MVKPLRNGVVVPKVFKGNIRGIEGTMSDDRADTLYVDDDVPTPALGIKRPPLIGGKGATFSPPDALTIPGWRRKDDETTREITPPTIVYLSQDDIIEELSDNDIELLDDPERTGEWKKVHDEGTLILAQGEETPEIKENRPILVADITCIDPLVRYKMSEIEQILADLMSKGALDKKNLQGKILDFRMGSGAGVYVLQQFGGDVFGVDQAVPGVRYAVQQRLISGANVSLEDELLYLSKVARESLSLVTAFNFNVRQSDLVNGIKVEAQYYARLYDLSKKALKKRGQLVITCPEILAKDLQSAFDAPQTGNPRMLKDVLTYYGSEVRKHNVFCYTKV